jgi:flagellar hook assembly protein FlgD
MNHPLLISVPCFLALLLVLTHQQAPAFGQVKGQEINGNAVNSLYLTISDPRYRQGDFNDQITGTVTNNSSEQIGTATIYAALFNTQNQLLSMESGSMTVSPLPAGDNSPFDIPIYGLGEGDVVDHFTLFPVGSPS